MINYMKIKKIRKNRSKIISIIVIAVIIVAGASYWYWQTCIRTNQLAVNNSQVIDQNINYNPPTADQKNAGEDIKINNQTPVSVTANTVITSKTIDADTLKIRSVTSGAISSNGTCNLTLTSSDGIVISKTVATYAMPSSSTCQGFDIARTELPNGIWQISLDVIIDNEKSNATSEIILE